MKNNYKKIVIALGGSVICPKEIDTAYIKQFYKIIKEETKKGFRFVIVAGGGNLARSYQRSALLINNISNIDKDWLGIYSTYLNAQLLRAVFKKEANPIILDKRKKIKNFKNYSVIIASGWSPGRSTDFIAVQIAQDLKAEKVVILGKPSYIYTKDPDKEKDTKPIFKMNWNDYLKMIPLKWTPGLSLPIDPIAAKLAKKEKKEVIVADGKDLKNFRNILKNKKFKGTLVQ